MSTRDIINALNALDEELVLEAKHSRNRKRYSVRKLLLLAAVVAVIGTLALSAVAASDGAGWFQAMFLEKSGAELTRGQEIFIQENTVEVGKSQTQNGYTLTLDSAFSDGKLAYFRFTLTAPEGTKLDASSYWDLHGAAVQNEEGTYFFGGEGFGMVGHPTERKENSVQLLYTWERHYLENVPSLSGHTWTIYIYGLQAGYPDEELGLRYEPLAEGCWSFQIQFPEGCERELELIGEPVTVQCALGVGARMDPEAGIISITGETSPVALTSFKLRALTAELSFQYAGKEQINGDFGDIYAVMKDGTHILLNSRYGSPNFLGYTFDAPIDLDQIDHILLRDGTVLPVQ